MSNRFSLQLLLLFLLPACLFAGEVNFEKRWEALFNSGKTQLEAGKYQEAIDDLIGSLSFDPENPRSIALLGTIFYRLQKPESARYYWEKGLIYHPEDPIMKQLLQLVYKVPLPDAKNIVQWKTLHNQAEALLFDGRNEESIELFNKALKFFPSNIYSRFSIGMAYYQMNKMDKARAAWSEIQKDEPENVMVRDILRVLDTNKIAKRIKLEKELIDAPKNWKKLFELATIYLGERKFDAAELYFKKVLSYHTTHTGAIQGLSAIAVNRRDYKKSVDILKKGLSRAPDNKVLLSELEIVGNFAEIMSAADKLEETVDVEEMVLVPAGEFIFGNNDPDTNVDERPIQHITLDAFYIDRYEVSNLAYYNYTKKSGAPPPEHWGGQIYRENQAYLPLVNINWYEADIYCKWHHKRLPTEQEWEKAARGVEGLRFPWGDEFNPQKTNTRANYFRRPASIVAFQDGVSPYGIFNMAGNVWEWTSDWYDRYPGNKLKRKEFGTKYKVQRGGSFLAEPILHARTAERDAQLPIFRHRTTGFRCVKDKTD